MVVIIMAVKMVGVGVRVEVIVMVGKVWFVCLVVV